MLKNLGIYAELGNSSRSTLGEDDSSEPKAESMVYDADLESNTANE